LQVDAVIDTGFTSYLTLPEHQITDLGLAWRGTVGATLADNKSTDTDLYRCDVMWDGSPRTILVASVETTPLVGMQLMKDYRLSIDVVAGGGVRLDPISKDH
jgi:clan AA aspartic protease